MTCWLVRFYMCKTHGRQFGSDSLKTRQIAITKFAHAQIFDLYAILLHFSPIFSSNCWCPPYSMLAGGAV